MTGFVCIENPPLDKALTIKWTNQTIRERTFKISKKLEINFKTDILKITKAGKGGIKNESES